MRMVDEYMITLPRYREGYMECVPAGEPRYEPGDRLALYSIETCPLYSAKVVGTMVLSGEDSHECL